MVVLNVALGEGFDGDSVVTSCASRCLRRIAEPMSFRRSESEPQQLGVRGAARRPASGLFGERRHDAVGEAGRHVGTTNRRLGWNLLEVGAAQLYEIGSVAEGRNADKAFVGHTSEAVD